MISQEIILILGGIILAIITVFGSILIYLTRTLVQHRNFYNSREKWLISAIIAKDLPELAQYASSIDKTAADELKQTALENDLAINAQKLINESRELEPGIPVT